MQERVTPLSHDGKFASSADRASSDPASVGYDDAIQVATALFSTPIAYISLIDGKKQWLAARLGIRTLGEETSSVFNEHVITSGAPLVVEDAEVDARFANHISVCGKMHLRFFAGVPMYVRDRVVGTLCVVDTVPRIVDSRKLAALAALGRQVSEVLTQRFNARTLELKEHVMVAHVEEARTSSTLHRLAARRFETLFHGVPMACFTFDERSVVHEWNREAERVFGRPAFDVLDEGLAKSLSIRRSGKAALGSIQQVLTGVTVEDLEWSYRRPDRQARRLLTSAFPLRGSLGQIVGGVCATIDITDRKLQERELKRANAELAAANMRLERLASYDGLTGIANYRAYSERLAIEFYNAQRSQTPMCLLLLDVDRFKLLNDTYGHPAGDRVLQTLAEILTQVSRKGDFVARYGGEEFVMLLPNTRPDVAGHVAERIRRAVAEYEWPAGQITISVGYAHTDGLEVPTPQELTTRADRALYQSKHEGRDRVTFFDVAA